MPRRPFTRLLVRSTTLALACTVLTCTALVGTALPAAAAVPAELVKSWASDGRFLGPGALKVFHADGRLVTYEVLEDGRVRFARFNADTSPDTTFGSGGYALPGLRVGVEDYGYVADVEALPDGGYLVMTVPGHGESHRVARLRADGALDRSFGNNGITRGDDSAWNSTYGGMVLTVAPDRSFSVAFNMLFDAHGVTRYSAKGVKIETAWLPYLSTCVQGCELQSADVQHAYYRPDGTYGVLLSGGPHYRGSWVVQLTPDGELDPAWGNGGIAKLPFAFSGEVVLAEDGDVLVSAHDGYSSLTPTWVPPVRVARLTGAGKLRTTWGRGGITNAWNGLAGGSRVTGLALDQLGRAVVAAKGVSTVNGATYCSITRFTSAGALDRTYSWDFDGTATDGGSGGWCSDVVAVPIGYLMGNKMFVS